MLTALFSLATCGFLVVTKADLTDDNWIESIIFGSQHGTTGPDDASNALTEVARQKIVYEKFC